MYPIECRNFTGNARQMSRINPRHPPNFQRDNESDATPAFLLRRRARTAFVSSSTPSWLNWNAATLLMALFGFAAILWLLSPILAPFLAAAILAYILAPLVAKMEAKGVSRAIGSGFAVLALLLAVVLLMLIVLPLFYKEIAQLVELFPGFAEQLKTRVVPWLNEKFGIAITRERQVSIILPRCVPSSISPVNPASGR